MKVTKTVGEIVIEFEGSVEEYKAFIEIDEVTSNSCSNQIAIAYTLNKEDIPTKPVVDKDNPST